MKKLNKKEMLKINGGAIEWNGTILTSFIKYIKLIFEIGQTLGTAARRNENKNYCSI